MNEKIMVVDDHDDIREVIHVLLTNEGYQIIEAKNGKEALELLDDSIDLIIFRCNDARDEWVSGLFINERKDKCSYFIFNS